MAPVDEKITNISNVTRIRGLKMKRILGLAVVLTLFGCGGSPHEKAYEEMICLFDQLSDEMAKITDSASADAAYSNLEILKVKMEKLSASMQKLSPLTRSEIRSLNEKIAPKLGQSLARFTTQIQRLMNLPGVSEELGEAMLALAPTST